MHEADPTPDGPGSQTDPSISVVIPTLGRSEALAPTLRSVGSCAPPPVEVIVVDGDPDGSAGAAVAEIEHSSPVKLRHIVSDPGLTRQRNRGVSEARGNIVVFFDDDVEVDRRALGWIGSAYRDPSVVGATGRVIESTGGRADIAGKSSAIRRFLFGGGQEGGFTRFGYPRRVIDPKATRDVEFMQGCFMSMRKEMAELVRFDEALTGYALAEDEDFSYRLSRLGRIRYVGDAIVEHKNLGFSTRDRRAFDKAVVVNRTYLFRKNFDRTLAARAQFAAFLLVLVAHRMLHREWLGVKGLVEGATEAWRTRR